MTARRTSVLVLLLAALVSWCVVGPADAHDELRSTTPGKDQQVAAAPGRVVLRFAEPVQATGTRVVVKGPGGATVSQDLKVAGDDVSVAVHRPAPSGSYRVVWRVTSQDGHPVSGSFTFRALAAAGAPAAAPTSTAGVPATGKASASPSPTQQVPTNKTNNEPVWIIVAVIVALALIAGGVVLSRRRLHDDEPADGPRDDTA